ncbi:hypothetical protein CICLE_v10023173mg [Citrus x clementina]|uniref:Uncharacterized protein n=2 Tax=Citrus TaxID=2706 RepID=A0A067EBH9_CITSI|nr:hypothetical protein CICLE_v10023173mg [Citrus x clementina]KDO52438.1 hypothetical protein CISIN_1g040985mg [Citrus sinensis]
MKKKDGLVKWVLLVDEADDDDSTWQIINDDDSTWQIITPILSKSSHGVFQEKVHEIKKLSSSYESYSENEMTRRL